MTTYISMHNVERVEVVKDQVDEHKWTKLCAYCSDGSTVEFTLHHASFDAPLPVRGDVELDL